MYLLFTNLLEYYILIAYSQKRSFGSHIEIYVLVLFLISQEHPMGTILFGPNTLLCFQGKMTLDKQTDKIIYGSIIILFCLVAIIHEFSHLQSLVES